MTSPLLARHAPVAARFEQVSGIRPITLLVAFGIVLITVILIATGIAAGQLRQQALASADSELGRIDSVLAEAIDRSFNLLDGELADIADQLRQAGTADGARLPAAATGTIGRSGSLSAVALLAGDGRVLDHSGAWPAGSVVQDELVALLQAQPDRASIIGAPIKNPDTGASNIPLLHRIEGPQGAAAGAVVGMIPVSYFADFFAAVPLDRDVVIALLDRNGTMLARYPEQGGSTAEFSKSLDLNTIFTDITAIMARHVGQQDNRGWRIEAWRAVSDHGVAVAVSRDADQALVGWARQGLWFAGFALAGANDNLAWPICLAYRIESIQNQIDDGLSQQSFVAAHQWQRIRLFHRQRDVFHSRIGAYDASYVCQKLFDVDGRCLRFALSKNRAHVLNDLDRAGIVANYIVQGTVDFGQIRSLGREQTAGGPRVVQDCSERLVQLMRQRGGHLSYRHDLRNAPKFLR